MYRRQSNFKQSLVVDSYEIIVSERVSLKRDEDGNACQYYTVFAKANDEKVYPKVEKTYQDFKNLELAINNNLRSNDIECPNLEKDVSGIDLSGWKESGDSEVPLTEKINNIKRFCRSLGADPALHCEPFFDFFKIPRVQSFYEGRNSDVDIMDKLRSTTNPGTHTDGSNIWNDFEKENSSDYCPYFRVAVLGPPESKEDKSENGKGSHNYRSGQDTAGRKEVQRDIRLGCEDEDRSQRQTASAASKTDAQRQGFSAEKRRSARGVARDYPQ
jgi:hypothetical protein